MREVEGYIDRIMFEASLVSWDDKRVRRELEEHLQEIVEVQKRNEIPTEEMMMKVEQEFGNPEELGKAIARAKGAFRTYLKKEFRPRNLILAVVIALSLRAVVVQSFVAKGEFLPEGIEQGNFVLVNKLANTFELNDVVVCKEDGAFILYGVKSAEADRITVVKPNAEKVIDKESIVGKIFLQTR